MYWLWYFGMPLILTILIEGFVAYLIGIRKDALKYVCLVNVVTNLTLNVLIALITSYSNINYYLLCAILEIAVIYTEYLFFRRYGIKKPFYTSVLLNLSSIGGGIIWKFLRH